MSARITRGQQLRDQIDGMLVAAGLPDVVVTLDVGRAHNGYRNGFVLVVPPRLNFTTWTEVEETWTLQIAAGPYDDPLAAWAVLDGILEALREGRLNMADAEPNPIQVVSNEPAWPGYVVTLNPDTVYP